MPSLRRQEAPAQLMATKLCRSLCKRQGRSPKPVVQELWAYAPLPTCHSQLTPLDTTRQLCCTMPAGLLRFNLLASLPSLCIHAHQRQRERQRPLPFTAAAQPPDSRKAGWHGVSQAAQLTGRTGGAGCHHTGCNAGQQAGAGLARAIQRPIRWAPMQLGGSRHLCQASALQVAAVPASHLWLCTVLLLAC